MNNMNLNVTSSTLTAPSLSPAPIGSTGSGNMSEGPKKPRGSSPGLPIPPRQQQQFKMQPRNVGNGALNKRKSPRLPVPFNPNQNQVQSHPNTTAINQQSPMFEGHHNHQQNHNPYQQGQQPLHLQQGQQTNGAGVRPVINPNFNGLPPRQALQAAHDQLNAAVIDAGGHTSLQQQQLINAQMAALNPDEFGSHDDIGFDDDDENQGKDRQNLYKTELCREWSTSGWCYYNKRCSFAHGLQELRPVFRSKKWRTKRCRNWHTTGYCPYEHRCQFLHDQSPPRRISDYATANARALVAAQQRMQPLYFHYQVDCDRNEEESDGGDGDENTKTNKSSIADTNRQSEINPNTPSIGPRLKRKGYNTNTMQPTNINNKHNNLLPNQNGNRNQNGSHIQNHAQNGIGAGAIGHAHAHSPNPALSPNPIHQNGAGANRDIPLPFKGSKVRMMPLGKKGKAMAQSPTLQIPTHKPQAIPPLNVPPRYQKQSRPKTPTSDASASPDQNTSQLMQHQNILRANAMKTERRKKKVKDAVITPFNPVHPYQTQQPYEIAAAQQLGLYDPRTAQLLPQVPVQAGAAALHGHLHGVVQQLGSIPGQPQGVPVHAVPQLNTVVPHMGHMPLSAMAGSNIHNAFPGLPPSIDPTLYLSLTPSPPASPANGPKPSINPNIAATQIQNPVAQQLQQQQAQALMTRSLAAHQIGQIPGPIPDAMGNIHHQRLHQGHQVGVAPEITPSPPLPLTMDPLAQHQHAQRALAKQHETLQLLQSKVHQVGQRQAHDANTMLLQRGINNKSATPVPPIGGDLLQSLLPTDDNEDTKIKPKTGLQLPPLPTNNADEETKQADIAQEETKDDEPSGFRSKSKDNPKTLSSSVPNTTKKGTESVKNLPPIPPIPPPLQLQTSINSVVTGAVAAAVTPTAVGFVPMTPTLADGTAAGMFGFPGGAASGQPATTTQQVTTTTQTITTPTTTVPTITGVVPHTLIPSIPQQHTAYTHAGLVPVDVTYAHQVQQQAAHAHAHAYAAAQAQAQAQVHAHQVHGVHPMHAVPTAYATHGVHAAQAQHVAYGHTVQVPVTSQYPVHAHAAHAAAAQYGHIGLQHIPIQPQMGYAAAQTFYAPSPEFQEIPQQTYHTTGYAQYQHPPRHHYQ